MIDAIMKPDMGFTGQSNLKKNDKVDVGKLQNQQLCKLLDSPDWQIKAAVVEELGKRKVYNSLPDLMNSLYDDNPIVRSSAVESLRRMGWEKEACSKISPFILSWHTYPR